MFWWFWHTVVQTFAPKTKEGVFSSKLSAKGRIALALAFDRYLFWGNLVWYSCQHTFFHKWISVPDLGLITVATGSTKHATAGKTPKGKGLVLNFQKEQRQQWPMWLTLWQSYLPKIGCGSHDYFKLPTTSTFVKVLISSKSDANWCVIYLSIFQMDPCAKPLMDLQSRLSDTWFYYRPINAHF